MKLSIVQKHGKNIEEYLKLETSIIALKLLKRKEDIPLHTKRPKKDVGYRLSLCQGLGITRREKTPISLLKEDMWCVEPVIGLGLAEPPKYFLEGNNRYPLTASTLDAGKTWAQSFPRFEAGKYIGVSFAPLNETTFIPDLIILYCTPAQLTQIMVTVNWIDGKDINCLISGHAACVYSIVTPMKNNNFQISVPCMGDRTKGMTQNNELIFSFPLNKLADLNEGLENLSKTGQELPVKFSIQPEYKLKESYIEIGKLMGMDF